MTHRTKNIDWNVAAAMHFCVMGAILAAAVVAPAARAADENADAIARAAELLQSDDVNELHMAAQLIAAHPRQGVELLDELVKVKKRAPNARLSGAIGAVLMFVSEDKLYEHWGNPQLVGNSLSEVVRRMMPPGPKSAKAKALPRSEIDPIRAQKRIAASLKQNKNRLECLNALGVARAESPKFRMTDELFAAVLSCTEDGTKRVRAFCCGASVTTYAEMATAIATVFVREPTLGAPAELPREQTILSELKTDSARRRFAAVSILGTHRDLRSRHSDVFYRVIQDPDLSVRRLSLKFLVQLQGQDDRINRAFRAIMKDDRELRGYSLYLWAGVLARSSVAEARAAIPYLVEMISEGENDASQSRYVLTKIIGKLNQSDLDGILEQLKSGIQQRRMTELRVVQAMERRGGKAEPWLREGLLEGTMLSRLEVARTHYLVAADAGRVLPVFRKGLASDDKRITSRALSFMKVLGPDGAPLVPALITGLKADPSYRYMFALEAIGPKASAALPLLEQIKANSERKSQAKYAQRAIDSIRGVKKK